MPGPRRSETIPSNPPPPSSRGGFTPDGAQNADGREDPGFPHRGLRMLSASRSGNRAATPMLSMALARMRDG
jgi:hypothetical protein